MDLNEKQIEILQIAEKLFSENGFDGTSVRQISKEAGINVAMISYYFGSKEKLLEALLIYRMSDFRMELASVLSNSASILDSLDNIIALIIRRLHRNRRTHKIINFEYSNSGRQIDFDLYLAQKKENYKVLEDFIAQGQESGVFVKDVNTVLLTSTVLGTYFNFYYNKKYYQLLLNLPDSESIDHYVHNDLTLHIQKTIKALLTNDK